MVSIKYIDNCKSKTKIKERMGMKEYYVNVLFSEIYRHDNNKNRKRVKRKKGKENKFIDSCRSYMQISLKT